MQGFIVLLNKYEDWTSFDVVRKTRNITRIRKMGHSGTLDPFATGLMILGAGKGTKLMTELIGRTKRYRACIQFGVSTDTYDRTGEVLSRQESFDLQEETVRGAVEEMTGKMEQVPPMFSAKKVDGTPLYKLARKGISVERKVTQVEIISARVRSWKQPFLDLELHVSKGTYVRSYAHDLGKRLGVGGMLLSLHRTAIDPYRVEDSFTIDEFQQFWKKRVVCE
jgi:tRNA pseudouridine55 synthase